MKNFIKLINQLESTTKTNEKINLIAEFFLNNSKLDNIWLVGIFLGKTRFKRFSSIKLRKLAQEISELPDWLAEESYLMVGDSAETIALILSKELNLNTEEIGLYEFLKVNYFPLLKLKEEEQFKAIKEIWKNLDEDNNFVFNKILMGGFRIGVSKKIVINALSKAYKIEVTKLTHRLMGVWDVSEEFFESLVIQEESILDVSKPYPFCLANPIEFNYLNNDDFKVGDYIFENKYDGIRCQLIKRSGEIFLWSRGEELLNGSFPEIIEAAKSLDFDFVFDGELLEVQNGLPSLISEIQKRINRKVISQKLITKSNIKLYIFDFIEFNGIDLRNEIILKRKEILNSLLIDNNRFKQVNIINFENNLEMLEYWKDSRNRNVEGLMIKAKNSLYEDGRKKGVWWKYKVNPYTIDAVLIYAQIGHGKRSGLYTDYTFGLWRNGELITFAKAYSGLTNKEIIEVDKFIKANTVERFGPVRTVKPELVFELAFEGINLSKRHKSGVAVRFPRILRIRLDKKINEANSIEDLLNLIKSPIDEPATNCKL